MKQLLLATTLIFATVGFATAQQKKTPLSPPAEATATIGGKAVSIKYGAPTVRNRKIFGGLVPFGEVWISPSGAYIAIPRPGADGTYPDGVVRDLLDRHVLPDPKPSS